MKSDSETETLSWRYPHIEKVGALSIEQDSKNYFCQEKLDGANITIKFEMSESDTNEVKRTFYSRNMELEVGSKFFDIWSSVKTLRPFFDDVDDYVRSKLTAQDTLLLNCELFGNAINKRIFYDIGDDNRLACFDCRLNGEFMTGVEFLAFQSEFLANKGRYPYWPFVISFNFHEPLAQFGPLYECKQLVDVPMSSLTSEKIYDEFFDVIRSIKPRQNKFEGLVYKSLSETGPIYKQVFDAFKSVEDRIIVESKKSDHGPNEKEEKMIEACTRDYMINCRSKRPWTNFAVFQNDLLQDLKEDGFDDDSVDLRKIRKLLTLKIKELFNPRDGSQLGIKE